MIYGQKEIQPHNFQDYFGPLRWHYPDQVIRVFLSLHKEGHPESFGCDNKSQRRMVMSSARVVNEEKRQFYNRVNKLFDI